MGFVIAAVQSTSSEIVTDLTCLTSFMRKTATGGSFLIPVFSFELPTYITLSPQASHRCVV